MSFLFWALTFFLLDHGALNLGDGKVAENPENIASITSKEDSALLSLSSLALLPPYPGHSWDLELEWTGPARCGGDSYHSRSERELSSLCGCGAAAYCSLQDSRWSGLFSDEFGWSGLVLLCSKWA